jgi:hypothetical protein
VLLDQSPCGRTCGNRRRYLLQDPRERQANESDVQRKIATIGSRWSCSDDGPDRDVHTITAVRRTNAPLEEQSSHWVVGRVRCHRGGLHYLGNRSEGTRDDSQAAGTF